MKSPSSDRPTEVGLIGFGLGGATFHAPFIAATPGLHLAAVMTTDPARRHGVEERYPDTKVVGTIDELLAFAPKVELISISSPNASHYPLAKAALQAGRNVVVDKPFAVTSAQARELAAIAKANGVKAMPFQNRRWDGDFLTVRKLIADDRLGQVFRFESRFDRWRGEPKAGWMRADWAERAENIVHDIGTHLIDQALVLFGDVTHVYAELVPRRAGVVSFDDAFIALTHANGVSSHLYMSASAGQAGPRISVFASKGAYLKYGLDVQEDSLKGGMRPTDDAYGAEPSEKWGTLVGPGVNEIVPTSAGAYPSFYAGVARSIREGASAPVPVDDVVRGLEIIEAAFVSHSRRQVVAV